MIKKNNSGITLISLVITIIILLILASIGINSGVSTIRSSKLTKFTTEMKMMQSKVNELYDSYSNNRTVNVNNKEYVGKGVTATEDVEAKAGIQEIGKNMDKFSSNKISKIFSSGESGITDSSGYMYYDTETINGLGLDNIEGEYFVNVAKRSVVSVEPFKYDGKNYYTLEQLPDSLYNVEYDKESGKVSFDFDSEVTEGKGILKISNIKYDNYINKWQVRYREKNDSEEENEWKTTEEFTGDNCSIDVLNKNGKKTYEVQIIHGDEVKSDIKETTVEVIKLGEMAEPSVGTGEDFNMENGVIEVEFLKNTSYNTTTVPNQPILKDGMTPITYDENGIAQNIDSSNINWYNYVSKTGTNDNNDSKWANVKVTEGNDDSYFVWIPRYAYRIVYFDSSDSANQYRAGTLSEEDAIKDNKIVGYSDARGIVDVDGKTKKDVAVQTSIVVNNKYFRTHPVFEDNTNCGGWSSKLQGFWMAKYEASEGENSNPKSVPGVESWVNLTIGNMFTNSKNYNETLNSHMIKNSEWGAVAYLAESRYGRNGTQISLNNSASYITGSSSGMDSNGSDTYEYNSENGVLASTTGNIYGVYDMTGGAYEYVAIYNKEGATLKNGEEFTFSKESNEYSTVYENDELNNAYKYGDGTYETKGWHGDCSNFMVENSPFCVRGGYYNDKQSAGIFYYQVR